MENQISFFCKPPRNKDRERGTYGSLIKKSDPSTLKKIKIKSSNMNTLERSSVKSQTKIYF